MLFVLNRRQIEDRKIDLDDVKSRHETKHPIRFAFTMMSMFWTAVCLADISVKSVEAQQRYPWNGLVDIVVTIQGASNDVAYAAYTFTATNTATQAAIPVSHVTRKGGIVGSGTTWSQCFIWDAAADVGAVKIDDVALTVEADYGVQLWENGPYWAQCNVGASKPEEYGFYFWWGDTVGYKLNASNNGWVSVKDGTAFKFRSSPSYQTSGKDNSTLQSQGYIDSIGNLVAAHDAATVHLGSPWRMPTAVEFSALVNHCTTTWVARNGVYGQLVTGKGAYASKNIFLPAAGYDYGFGLCGAAECGSYWSSSPVLDLNSGCNAHSLKFGWGLFRLDVNCFRSEGRPVRPIRGFAK